ncbi:hypothetical protein ABE437_20105 [Isoptericola cucumis]|uniref:hypothetical protein n=1 Tax=Isoptericola cucumis TaxID=1776856 RepID=UPI0032087849
MSVLWQQVPDVDAVEAPLDELPAADRPGWLRRWLWAPALVVAVGLYVVRRTIEDPSGEVEMWLFLGMLAALMVTAVASLVRYRDDQRTAAETRAAKAFASGARSVTGTVLVRERTMSGGRLLSGLVSYPTDDGTAEQTWSHMLKGRPDDAADDADERAEGTAALPPRDGDPVAVWWAPGTETVVVRYHRDWADAVRRRARGR